MLKRRVLCLVATGIATVANMPAQARDAEILRPDSEWFLEYGEERCALSRLFGENHEIKLRIETFGHYLHYRLTLWGDVIPHASGPTGTLRYRLTPDQALREVSVQQGQTGDMAARFISLSFGPPTTGAAEDAEPQEDRSAEILAFQQQVTNMEIHFDRRRIYDLQMGGFPKALAALETCAENLHRQWGVDPELHRTLSRQPRPGRDGVARIVNSYPSSQRARGVSAYIPVRVMVAADGTASDCTIQVDGVDEDFRNAVCSNLTRPFEPALDRDGRPVASVYLSTVFYHMN